MSIFSQLVTGQITIAQAETEAEVWLGQTVHNIETTVQNDPAVQRAVNDLIVAGKAAIVVGEDWAGTAISTGLAAFSAEIAASVAKYIPLLAGGAGGVLTAAGLTAIQAIASVGVAAVQHEIASAVSAAPAKAA